MTSVCLHPIVSPPPFRNLTRSSSKTNCVSHGLRDNPILHYKYGRRDRYTTDYKSSTNRSFSHIRCSKPPIAPTPSLSLPPQLQTALYSALSVVTSQRQVLSQSAQVISVTVLVVWGLPQLVRRMRAAIVKKDVMNDGWDTSPTHDVLHFYITPFAIFSGIFSLCRVWEPATLLIDSSAVIRQRLLIFVQKSILFAVFAYMSYRVFSLLVNIILDMRIKLEEVRHPGEELLLKFIAIVVAVISNLHFLGLMGFPTQQWMAASGLGTLVVSLAFREFTENFLAGLTLNSSRTVMVNDWVQFTIEGQSVSGNVEKIDWVMSVIRGDDRERIYCPNSRLLKVVLRNLSQRGHWRIKEFFHLSIIDRAKIKRALEAVRKYIGKHPQLEQKTLHRRAVLWTINPEIQAMQVQLSVFVKTTIFEEFVRVREQVIMDVVDIFDEYQIRLSVPAVNLKRMHDSSDIFSPSASVPPMLPMPSTPIPQQPQQQQQQQQQQQGEQTLQGRQQDQGPATALNQLYSSSSSSRSSRVNQKWSESEMEESREMFVAAGRRRMEEEGIPDAAEFEMDEEVDLSQVKSEEVRKILTEEAQLSAIVTSLQSPLLSLASFARGRSSSRSSSSNSNSIKKKRLKNALMALAALLQDEDELSDSDSEGVGDGEGEGDGGLPDGLSSTRASLEGLESLGLNSRDITLLGAAFEKPPVDFRRNGGDDSIPAQATVTSDSEPTMNDELVATLEHTMALEAAMDAEEEKSGSDKKENGGGHVIGTVVDVDPMARGGGDDVDELEKSPLLIPTNGSPVVEDNLVLGVALSGPKKVLEIVLQPDVSEIGVSQELAVSIGEDKGVKPSHVSGKGNERLP